MECPFFVVFSSPMPSIHGLPIFRCLLLFVLSRKCAPTTAVDATVACKFLGSEISRLSRRSLAVSNGSKKERRRRDECCCDFHPSVGRVVDFHGFLFERELTKTDVNPSEARLFTNEKEMKEVLLGALRRREEELVFDRKKGLEVQVIDRLGNRYKTCLKF